MNSFLAQIKQWPPTSTTVMGSGFLAGLVSYWITGSVEGAVAVAGLVKVFCPQDAPAIDAGLGEARKITTAPSV